MKKKIERRKRIVKGILKTVAFVSVMLLIGVTGTSEHFNMSTVEYALWAVPCIAVFGFTLYLYDVWFGKYID